MPEIVKIIEDPQLGEVLFRKNNNAKKYIIRIKQNRVTVTIPYRGSYKEASIFFEKNRTLVIQKSTELKSNPPDNSYRQDAVLRHQAQLFLPEELERLAKEHGFVYQEVKIRKSRTRWGSCSSKRTISLSIYLMSLPPHLIEYVLLHELCHTIEMNHSPAFWSLMDKHTGGKSKELKKELRNYHAIGQ
ncbi:MAG: M48 family metallopeptidase [Candidatus Symbiothrix sp.]|jgi:predicted metal-dependent hydrolase|nr:M48 family metallopeptidase [Candidatus Symbiothrix sp.]